MELKVCRFKGHALQDQVTDNTPGKCKCLESPYKQSNSITRQSSSHQYTIIKTCFQLLLLTVFFFLSLLTAPNCTIISTHSTTLISTYIALLQIVEICIMTTNNLFTALVHFFQQNGASLQSTAQYHYADVLKGRKKKKTRRDCIPCTI